MKNQSDLHSKAPTTDVQRENKNMSKLPDKLFSNHENDLPKETNGRLQLEDLKDKTVKKLYIMSTVPYIYSIV